MPDMPCLPLPPPCLSPDMRGCQLREQQDLPVKQDEQLLLVINPYGPIGDIMFNLRATQLTEQEVKELLKQCKKERIEDLPELLEETVKVDFRDKMLTELDKNGEVLAIWF